MQTQQLLIVSVTEITGSHVDTLLQSQAVLRWSLGHKALPMSVAPITVAKWRIVDLQTGLDRCLLCPEQKVEIYCSAETTLREQVVSQDSYLK